MLGGGGDHVDRVQPRSARACTFPVPLLLRPRVLWESCVTAHVVLRPCWATQPATRRSQTCLSRAQALNEPINAGTIRGRECTRKWNDEDNFLAYSNPRQLGGEGRGQVGIHATEGCECASVLSRCVLAGVCCCSGQVAEGNGAGSSRLRTSSTRTPVIGRKMPRLPMAQERLVPRWEQACSQPSLKTRKVLVRNHRPSSHYLHFSQVHQTPPTSQGTT